MIEWSKSVLKTLQYFDHQHYQVMHDLNEDRFKIFLPYSISS